MGGPRLVRRKYRSRAATAREKTRRVLPGQAIQNEYAHLHGFLFIDKLGPIGKIAAKGAIAAFERMHQQAQKKGEIPPDAELIARLEELAKLA